MGAILQKLASNIWVYKIISIVFIFITAQITIKIFNKILKRWHKIAVNKVKDSLWAEYSLETRFAIIKRMANAAILSFAVILVFLQFESVRSIGVGLFASAGLASIVLGLAAQNTLSNIIAGISLSFSQPIRLHDAVVFKGEFGFIEEISLTHVIIATWDNRRIVVPNSIMANEVIQNWTIKGTVLIGSVTLYVDYLCEVEKIRSWAKDVVSKSANSTSERLAVVQVIDLTEHAMVVRVLVKGPDAAKTWDLRCEVREYLINKIKEAGAALPQTRVSILNPGGKTG